MPDFFFATLISHKKKSLQLPYVNEAKFSPKDGLSSSKRSPRLDILGSRLITRGSATCAKRVLQGKSVAVTFTASAR